VRIVFIGDLFIDGSVRPLGFWAARFAAAMRVDEFSFWFCIGGESATASPAARA
jgi:hypothetical protein